MEPQVRKALLVQPALQVQMDWMVLQARKAQPDQQVPVVERQALQEIPVHKARQEITEQRVLLATQAPKVYKV